MRFSLLVRLGEIHDSRSFCVQSHQQSHHNMHSTTTDWSAAFLRQQRASRGNLDKFFLFCIFIFSLSTKMATEEQLRALDLSLNSATTPLAQRFRSLFTLKSIGSIEAIEIIGKGPLDTPLLRCIGS